MNFSQETSLANVYKNALLLPGGSLMTCDHNVEGLEHSFYKLLTEWLPSDPKLSFSVNSFILGMGKSLVDFQNRFPGGPPLPDRRVNLPKRDPKSNSLLLQRNIPWFSTSMKPWSITGSIGQSQTRRLYL